jgi:hypothetical protein
MSYRVVLSTVMLLIATILTEGRGKEPVRDRFTDIIFLSHIGSADRYARIVIGSDELARVWQTNELLAFVFPAFDNDIHLSACL